MLRVGREIATEIGTDAQGRAQAWAPLLDAAVRDARFNETLLAHSRPLFAAVVRPTYCGLCLLWLHLPWLYLLWRYLLWRYLLSRYLLSRYLLSRYLLSRYLLPRYLL